MCKNGEDKAGQSPWDLSCTSAGGGGGVCSHAPFCGRRVGFAEAGDLSLGATMNWPWKNLVCVMRHSNGGRECYIIPYEC